MKIQEIINNKNEQVKKLEQMFEWLKNCPFDYKISSMQGDNLFLKVKLFENEKQRLSKEDKDAFQI